MERPAVALIIIAVITTKPVIASNNHKIKNTSNSAKIINQFLLLLLVLSGSRPAGLLASQQLKALFCACKREQIKVRRGEGISIAKVFAF